MQMTELFEVCGKVMEKLLRFTIMFTCWHYSESLLFPAKPLRDSQSHLLTDTPSWSDISAKAEKGKIGKELIYAATICSVICLVN